MTISDSTVAIIGTGNIGSRLAANFAAGGQDFLLAGRDQEAAAKLASDLGGHAEVVSVDEAIERADVLLPAIWLDRTSSKLIAWQYGDRLAEQGDRRPVEPRSRPDSMTATTARVIGEQGVVGSASGSTCSRPGRGFRSRRSAYAVGPHAVRGRAARAGARGPVLRC